MSNSTRAEALVEELNKAYTTTAVTDGASVPPRFVAIQADASERSSIAEMVNRVIAIFGRLDVVASNSGWTRITNFNDMDENSDEDLWIKTYRHNVTAHFWLMNAVKPHLEATKGAFVTTASLAGVVPGGSSLPYAISKAAQIYLVKTLSKVCAPHIRVNSVSPSLMLTDWGLQFSEEQQLAQTESSRLKRLITVEVCASVLRRLSIHTYGFIQDTASVVRMLLTNESMTGQNILVDCKCTAWSTS
jgi:NAD(P)-dependent dehydrogenase (short-subunit alcohol dehydrogenase family)